MVELTEVTEDAEAEEAMVLDNFYTGRAPKAMIKQLDKEIPWAQIPEHELHLCVAAGEKQWNEHLKYEAVRVRGEEESNQVRSTLEGPFRLPGQELRKGAGAVRVSS